MALQTLLAIYLYDFLMNVDKCDHSYFLFCLKSIRSASQFSRKAKKGSRFFEEASVVYNETFDISEDLQKFQAVPGLHTLKWTRRGIPETCPFPIIPPGSARLALCLNYKIILSSLTREENSEVIFSKSKHDY